MKTPALEEGTGTGGTNGNDELEENVYFRGCN